MQECAELRWDGYRTPVTRLQDKGCAFEDGFQSGAMLAEENELGDVCH